MMTEKTEKVYVDSARVYRSIDKETLAELYTYYNNPDNDKREVLEDIREHYGDKIADLLQSL